MTEYQCHILPGIDDGSDSVDTSLKMVEMMKAQGVERICATPHFYAHREKSIEDYLQKRKAAFDSIKDSMAVQDVHLGAEIAIEHGISELPGIEKLAIEGTRIILLELPYRAYEKWMSEEIYNIAAEYKLKVMLAHVTAICRITARTRLKRYCPVSLSCRSIMKHLQAGKRNGWRRKSWQSIRTYIRL